MTTSTTVESSDYHNSAVEQGISEPMDMSSGMQNLLSIHIPPQNCITSIGEHYNFSLAKALSNS